MVSYYIQDSGRQSFTCTFINLVDEGNCHCKEIQRVSSIKPSFLEADGTSADAVKLSHNQFPQHV